MASASSGSSILTTWKRRVSAASFSTCCLYSLQVVAPIVRRVPRASAGFRRLAASPVPEAPPAPIRVWASSMNRMIGVSELWTSSITCLSRCSNSPFIEAPASSRPTSRVLSATSCSTGGTSPLAIRSAKPSTTAVLPTPASPTSIGLFCRRRSRMSTTCRISASRPITGSILPARACSVRSIVKRRKASALPIGAGARSVASPSGAASAASIESAPLPSGEPARTEAKSLRKVSAERRRNCSESANSTRASSSFSSRPISRWPLRMRPEPNRRLAAIQPRSMASSMWPEKSSIAEPPPRIRSSALAKSAARRAWSMPNARIARCRSESGSIRS